MGIDRRWRFGGLVGSLLLNVFLVGLIGGHLVADEKQEGRRAENALVPGANVRALPADQRSLFAAGMKTHRDAIREARKNHLEARRRVEADLAAPTFDRTRITADFAALRQANLAAQEAVNAALIDALQPLGPQTRASLVVHERESHPNKP